LTGFVAIVALAGFGWGGDQAPYYRGVPEECCTSEEARRSVQDGFRETIPFNIGSGGVVLFAVGVHVEPHLEYFDPIRYELDRARLLRLAEQVERHGGRLVIQLQRPFTEVALRGGDTLLADLAQRGHELALHFHEDFHLPQAHARPISDWVAALRREMDLIEAVSGRRPTTWSGGNLYPQMFQAALAVGLQTNINYKDPRSQAIPTAFLVVSPWRPASSASVDTRAAHDPVGKIVYVPSGLWPAHCPGAEGVPKPYTYRALDYLTVALRNSLSAADPDKVNTFILTVHPGDFLAPADDEAEFAVWEAWLGQVLDPLVRAGRVRWATVAEMVEAYCAWEVGLP